MSIVIAIKTKDGVVIGADKQTTTGGHISTHISNKVFKSKWSNTAIGMVGERRNNNIITHNIVDLIDPIDILNKKDLDEEYVVNRIIPRIYNLLVKHYVIQRDSVLYDFGSDFIIVSHKNIFRISGNGSVIEKEDYAAIGCGKELVKGYFETIDFKEIDLEKAKELIKKAILQSCKEDVYIDNNVNITILPKEDK